MPVPSAHAVRVVDSTLREGEQTPSVCFSSHSKLAIADLLSEIGVDIIEAGHPRVSDEISSVIQTLSRRGLKATVGAHSRSNPQDVDLALECGAGFIGIFFCVSDERLEGVHRMSLEECLNQVSDSVSAVRSARPDMVIRYTPEDAVRSSFENVVAASVAALEAGADVISVADTTGMMMPGTAHSLFDYVTDLRAAFAERGFDPDVAVHCHNDRGLALANALDGVRAGASVVDASVLGLGERAGIVDLAQLLTALQQLGHGTYRLNLLPQLYKFVAREAGTPVPVNQPMLGANAFTHCAGVHTRAALANPLHYQSLDPALFGRSSEICLDHMSGNASLKYALERAGVRELEAGAFGAVLSEVRDLGRRGRRVEIEELPYIVACHAGA